MHQAKIPSSGYVAVLIDLRESKSLSLITSRSNLLEMYVGGSLTHSHLPSVVMCQGCYADSYFRQTHSSAKDNVYISSSDQRKWAALPWHAPWWSDSSHFDSVTFMPLDSTGSTRRLQALCSVLSESNSLVASPRPLSLLLILCNSVPTCHLPTHSALTPSATCCHSSWVKPVCTECYLVLSVCKC